MHLIGHEQLLSYFKRLSEEGALSHAYLFAGPRSLGKRRLADEIAAIIHCQPEGTASLFSAGEPSAEVPCGRCAACIGLRNGTYADHLVLSKETEGKHLIGINAVRETMRQIAQSSALGGLKTLIVDDAHLLSQGAANAFLKTLEEPPASSRIFLITDQPHRLPQTILSRCQLIEMGISHTPPEQADAELWRLSSGLPGEYVRMLEDEAAAEQRREELRLFAEFISQSKARRLTLLEELFKKKDDHISQKDLWKKRLSLWQQMLRDLTMLQLGLRELAVYPLSIPHEAVSLNTVAASDQLRALIDDIDRNVNIRLRLESFALNL